MSLIGGVVLLVVALATADSSGTGPLEALDVAKLEVLARDGDWADLLRELVVIEPAQRRLPLYAFYKAQAYYGMLWLAAGDNARNSCIEWMIDDKKSAELIEDRQRILKMVREVAEKKINENELEALAARTSGDTVEPVNTQNLITKANNKAISSGGTEGYKVLLIPVDDSGKLILNAENIKFIEEHVLQSGAFGGAP